MADDINDLAGLIRAGNAERARAEARDVDEAARRSRAKTAEVKQKLDLVRRFIEWAQRWDVKPETIVHELRERQGWLGGLSTKRVDHITWIVASYQAGDSERTNTYHLCADAAGELFFVNGSSMSPDREGRGVDSFTLDNIKQGIAGARRPIWPRLVMPIVG